jgi:16S rRNA (adenine1518-N6/adenine1519-N6)-dimethyltransferase
MPFNPNSADFNPKKSLGQNFLVDDNIARKIVNSFNIQDNDLILEIGPGYGSLTKHLIHKTKDFLAIELDKNISKYLTDTYKDIKIINTDFLELELIEIQKAYLKNIRIIGNIPYNITSQIIFHIIGNRSVVNDILIMMQYEVAQRIVAKPRTKNYGILSVFSQCYSTPKLMFKIPPQCFKPKPDIFSGMVYFDLTKNIADKINNEDLFRKIVRTSFGKRRKVLRNSLKEMDLNLEQIDFDLSKRPEELSALDFIKLSNIINL